MLNSDQNKEAHFYRRLVCIEAGEGMIHLTNKEFENMVEGYITFHLGKVK
jgi:hypothetical protein